MPFDDLQLHSKRPSLYVVGLILIILSFIACAISFYLVIFGVPVFIVGSILVLASRVSVRRKLSSILLPLLLWLPASYIFLFFYNRTTPQTFLIPRGFTGSVKIIHNEPCGITPNYEKDRRVLVIPSSGILIISEKIKGGRMDHQYFLVDSVGRREMIPFTPFLDSSLLTQTHIRKMFTGMMSRYPNAVDFRFEHFEVYDPEVSPSENNVKADQQFDSLTYAAIDACRLKMK